MVKAQATARPRTRNARRDSGDPHMTALWIILMVVFLAQLLMYTWCRMQNVHAGYDIAFETKRQRKLATLQTRLKTELASLKAPERLAAIARQRFGLKMPTAEQMITINENGR